MTTARNSGRDIKNGLVKVIAFRVPIVRRPSHPFRFRGQVPFIRVQAPNQSRLDLGLTGVRAIVRRQELRSISGDSPAPALPARVQAHTLKVSWHSSSFRFSDYAAAFRPRRVWVDFCSLFTIRNGGPRNLTASNWLRA
jgi:hypothetical protein